MTGRQAPLGDALKFNARAGIATGIVLGAAFGAPEAYWLGAITLFVALILYARAAGRAWADRRSASESSQSWNWPTQLDEVPPWKKP